jgi:FkbM family methyltransferase
MSEMPNLLKILINGGLRHAGFRLVRVTPPPLPPEDIGLRQLLAQLGISVVFDVGAHSGQYATRLRHFGYRGRIVSFEPQATAFADLTEKARLDPQWEPVRLALGDRETEQDLNISQNSLSSSFLSVSPNILGVEPGIAKIEVERVLIKTLDQVCHRFIDSSDRVFLKIDAQGYEPQILNGALAFLSRCEAVQMEMALFPSYQGQQSFSEMMEFMSESGFSLVHLERGFWDARTGYLIEVDGVFVRTEDLDRAFRDASSNHAR